MKYIKLTTSVLSCLIIFNTYTTQEQHTQNQLNADIQEQKTTSLKNTIKELDPIITKAIDFSNAIGDWFEDLFDKKQHMSFNNHINDLGKIITAMYLGIVKPLENSTDDMSVAARTLTTILYNRAEQTYKVLDAHRTSKSTIKIGNALKKIDKKFKTEQEKTKLKQAFKDLVMQITLVNATLSNKVTKLETVVAENSVRTKRKGWWTLAWGLRYRLQCK